MGPRKGVSAPDLGHLWQQKHGDLGILRFLRECQEAPMPRGGCTAKRRPTVKFQNAALLLPVLGLLLSSLLTHCGAQQAPALNGQGMDPLKAGVTNESVPVFVSVELLKLVGLDEAQYDFHAIVRFQQSWTDPRADSIFKLIDGRANAQVQVAAAIGPCANTSAPLFKNSSISAPDFTSPACQQAMAQPPSCTRYCNSYAGETDDLYRCCDLLWLPNIRLRNILDMSQDREVDDVIWHRGTNGVHRQTQVYGRFSTALFYDHYPFDKQRLQVFLDPATSFLHEQLGAGAAVAPPFYIVPSAAFRRLNQDFQDGVNRTGLVAALGTDELTGWQIDSVTFSCTPFDGTTGNNTNANDSNGALADVPPLVQQTQGFSPDDTNEDYAINAFGNSASAANQVVQICAFTIEVTRLSRTAVVQSIIPVAFIGTLSFVIFFSAPEQLTERLSMEVTLFLSLTAVQFIFAGMLPLTSYLTDFDVFILLTYCLIMVIVAESLIVAYMCTREQHFERLSGRPGESGRQSSAGRSLKGAHGKECDEPSKRKRLFRWAQKRANAIKFPRLTAAKKPDSSEGATEVGPPEESSDDSSSARGADRPSTEGWGPSSLATSEAGPFNLESPQEGLSAAPLERKLTLESDLEIDGAPPSDDATGPSIIRGKTIFRLPSFQWKYDSSRAYVLACRIDAMCGITLLVAYITITAVIFAVGVI